MKYEDYAEKIAKLACIQEDIEAEAVGDKRMKKEEATALKKAARYLKEAAATLNAELLRKVAAF